MTGRFCEDCNLDDHVVYERCVTNGEPEWLCDFCWNLEQLKRQRRSEVGDMMETSGLLDEMRSQLTRAQDSLVEATAERDLLQEILDSRPAINAALPDSYVRWSQSVMSGEIYRAAVAARVSQSEGGRG